MADVSLPINFVESEQGNNWFTNGLDHDFYSEIVDGVWLVIQIRTADAPGFYVYFLEADEETIVNQIHTSCNGFYIRECHLPVAKAGEAPTYTVRGQ